MQKKLMEDNRLKEELLNSKKNILQVLDLSKIENVAINTELSKQDSSPNIDSQMLEKRVQSSI